MTPSTTSAQPREEGQDYLQKSSTAQADEIPIPSTKEGYHLHRQRQANYRQLAYYDADHDLLCFARAGRPAGQPEERRHESTATAAPRHYFNDTRHHRVHYTARATSRFREYFPQDPGPGFHPHQRSDHRWMCRLRLARLRRKSAISLPTFGWQRQTQTNLKRSVRFGGGLRV